MLRIGLNAGNAGLGRLDELFDMAEAGVIVRGIEVLTCWACGFEAGAADGASVFSDRSCSCCCRVVPGFGEGTRPGGLCVMLIPEAWCGKSGATSAGAVYVVHRWSWRRGEILRGVLVDKAVDCVNVAVTVCVRHRDCRSGGVSV